jgi:molecular chaperone GrpE
MNKNNEDLLNVDENLEDNSSNKKEEVSSEQEIKNEHNFENNENNSTKEFENKISELNDKLLRSLAENQNLRKIHEKEKEDLIKYSSTSFARESLNLADNLERAFLLFKENPKFKSEEFKDIGIGMELIEKELKNTFDKNGIKPIDSLGQKFDPNFHQALNEIEGEEDGKVVAEIQKGYMLHDRLLRPALVSISKKNNNKKEDSSKS